MDKIKYIKELSDRYDFDSFGITEATTSKNVQEGLVNFIEKGYSADMKWMDDTLFRRKNPKNLWSKAKSAIVFAKNYSPRKNPINELKSVNQGLVASYARRKDYHKFIKGKLKNIGSQISSKLDVKFKVFVDTAPLMEKPIANQAGIGWQGKHTNLVSKDFGSWLLLGIILISEKLPYNIKQEDLCGNCSKCLDVCPTNAFPEPYKLDSRKCISYHTIENKGHIPKEFREKIGNRIFGCDDCLAVCPWNKFANKTKDILFAEKININLIPLSWWLSINEEEFKKFTSGMPLKRTGYKRIVRNCLIAAGNSKNKSLKNKIIKHLTSEEPIIRVAAIWALKKILSKEKFNQIQIKYAPFEKDLIVNSEWCI